MYCLTQDTFESEVDLRTSQHPSYRLFFLVHDSFSDEVQKQKAYFYSILIYVFDETSIILEETFVLVKMIHTQCKNKLENPTIKKVQDK